MRQSRRGSARRQRYWISYWSTRISRRATRGKPVSVLDIHGNADGFVPYDLQAFSLGLITRKNGCGTTTAPATAPASAGDTTCVSYTGCPDGIEVTGCTVEGGGHVWFGSDNCGTGVAGVCSIVGTNSTTLVNTDAIWDFFTRHSR